MMINILVIDDSDIVQNAIKIFVAGENKIKIIGLFHNGLEALENIDNFQRPDIVLVDLMMPVMGGIKTTEEILRKFPDAKVIIVSDMNNPKIASCAIQTGARGYLIKSKLNAGSLINAIHSVQEGYYQIDSEIADYFLKQNFASHKDKTATQNLNTQNKVTAPVISHDLNKRTLAKKETLVLEDAWA